MVMVADSGPYTLGVRLTLIVQASSGETVAGKLVRRCGLREIAAVRTREGDPVRLRSSPPVLFNVTACELPVAPNAH